jgi:hypothetical protein
MSKVTLKIEIEIDAECPSAVLRVDYDGYHAAHEIPPFDARMILRAIELVLDAQPQ